MFSLFPKETILSQIADSIALDSSPSSIGKLIKSYPEYEEEILELAVTFLSRKYPAKDPFESEEEREQLLKSALEIYRNAVEQSQEDSFTGIKSKLRELKIDPETFKQSTGLTSFLILNLDQKLVDVTSIPSRILKLISDTLSVPSYALRNYLYSGLPSHGAANFKSFTAPTAAAKKSFEEIVSEDVSLTDEEKSKLIR